MDSRVTVRASSCIGCNKCALLLTMLIMEESECGWPAGLWKGYGERGEDDGEKEGVRAGGMERWSNDEENNGRNHDKISNGMYEKNGDKITLAISVENLSVHNRNTANKIRGDQGDGLLHT